MTRNAESHFANIPSANIQRSKMKIPFEHKTSFNLGQVIPIYNKLIYPGDSVKMTHSAVVRLQTLLTPIMDNLVLDFYWFFTPLRLIFDKTKEFFQENTSGPWVQLTQYALPAVAAPSGGFASGTIADYLGYPIGLNWSATDKNAPTVLPFRAYAMICSEFFRDENLTYPLNIPTSAANVTGSNGTNYIDDIAKGGMPFVAAKTHDYFTSCLPSAQKAAQPVTFPLINGLDAPVYSSKNISYGSLRDDIDASILDGLQFITRDNSGTPVTSGTHSGFLQFSDGLGTAYVGSGTSLPSDRGKLQPANLWTDLSSSVGAVTINELRLAFQLQKWYERAARGGTRMTELIRSMFGVTSPDARLQRPEYLGGNRIPIQINEVTNTSSDSGSQSIPLGHLGANSNTSDVNVDMVHSFTEWGYLTGVCVARIANHTYGQGIERELMYKTWTDFYWPLFSALGEMPVKKVSIYANGHMNDDEVFGYQEAFAEARYMPNRVSSEMRPGIANSLASWHLADYYQSSPTLSDSWIREDKTNLDRCLAVTSVNANQIFADFYFDAEFTRPMPMYSVPGLIDHF